MSADLDRRSASRVKQAVDREVDLVRLLLDEGFEAHHPDTGASIKGYCPFGFMHPDGGHERALRIYDSNSAWCFSCEEFFTPVRLASRLWDVSADEAARQLARSYGVATGDLEHAVASIGVEPPPDIAELADALRLWFDRQEFAGGRYAVRATARVLELVVMVKTTEEAAMWLSQAKVYVAREAERDG